MLERLEAVSQWLASPDDVGREFVAFIVWFGIVFVWRAFVRDPVEKRRAVAIAARTAFSLACIAIIAVSIGQAAVYATHAALFDPYEASVGCVTGLVGQGEPVYHAADAPARYVQIGYGPMLYFIDLAFVRLFGGTIQAFKLSGVASFIGALLLMMRATKRASSRFALFCPQALGATAVMALVLDSYSYFAFWARADPILLFCSVLGVWAIAERRLPLRMKAAVLGIALGIAFNLKITAVLYFFPLLVLSFFELGWVNTVFASGIALVVAAFPFLLPTVSIRNYLYWLGKLKSQGTGTLVVRLGYAEKALIEGLPVLAIWFFASVARVRRRNGKLFMSMELPFRTIAVREHAYVAAIGLSFSALVLVASKPGASSHHFMALFPVMVHSAVRMAPGLRRALDFRPIAGMAMGLVFLVHDWYPQKALWDTEVGTAPIARANIAFLKDFAAKNPGKVIEIGAGRNMPLMNYRAFFVLGNMPLKIDVGTLMDLSSLRQDDEPLPTKLYERVESCVVDDYLIEKGATPFSMAGVYYGHPVYDVRFRSAFAVSYAKTGEVGFYDLYTCQVATAPTPP